MAHILIVEDEANLRLTLADNLQFAGYQVTAVATLAAARQHLAEAELLILDIMLPDGDGYQFCQQLRQQGHDLPVLMLTARSLENDLVQGFEAGADDYLAKPYRLRELLLRVQALIRRGQTSTAVTAEPATTEQYPGFEINRSARTICADSGADVSLTAKEFDLLLYLLDHRNQALAREQILDRVWGENIIVDPRTVDNFISSLKRKLPLNEASAQGLQGQQGQQGLRLKTVRGIGYRLADETA